MKQHFPSKLLLFCIVLLAAFFRFSSVNWDQGNHLHPDERFLTMVVTAMKLPETPIGYLSPQHSTFNPTNVGYPFYVYGELPLSLTKLTAIAMDADNYMDITIIGRLLSAFLDLMLVFVIYKTVELLQKKYNLHNNTKYIAALLYAIAVLPIQLSHFFAVDTFLNFFTFSAFYLMLRYTNNPKNHLFLVCSGLLWGMGLSSKISAILYLPLLLFCIITAHTFLKKTTTKHTLIQLITALSIFMLTAYISIRIVDPYLFQSSSFINPLPNKLFLENIKTLQSWGNTDAWFPPGVQWIHKTPVLFPLQNLIIFGIGIPYALLVLIGLPKTWALRSWKIRGVLIWMLLFFLYQSTQTSTTMRYFIFLYPFLAIIAALGFQTLTTRWNTLTKLVLIGSLFIWPLLFYSIYTKPHSRVQASNWINTSLPPGSKLLSEHWDDALPLNNDPRKFTIDELHVYDPDTAEKWQKINTQLQNADYLILSSNRAWASIPTVPERYPLMGKFYTDLLNGKTSYKKIAEFTSYPSLTYLGIPIVFNDDWAEEAFTVYDHPKVMIFQRQ